MGETDRQEKKKRKVPYIVGSQSVDFRCLEKS